ncbi:alpha-1,2-fucosyltransferase [Helicobacter bilis]|uniref:alpha-1,2-fucosyltransferase n=1 Tax=Helicobacter bilis TaxID=37372 RepID=UPI00051E1287|nr:alpha-1,2-fucosyltransferase [Helicobacter bilis]MCI7410397.1 alpha-1,2-fucosyltransferase [Helicobacter bilis]MDD7296889.1 alpha-1,2-fucosyltransferase [Helicobacter bilis]MDY4399798.1 alpha-1,2-fucosyltransferase [Helicobacter bilis]TLE08402.1 alpha-1,2-fucosyltransferase [Helicobacter bilis]
MGDYKIVELTCGLGNQMFQYAFAKALQKHLQVPVLLDKTWYDTQDNSTQFSLDIFNVDLEYATNTQIEKAKARVSKLPGLLRKMFGLKKHNIAYSQSFDFHDEYLLPNDFTYFSGFFQNAKYLKGLEQELKSIFYYDSNNFSNFGKQRLELILQAKNSIFIHIRRGDYCKIGWELGMDYYKRAIQYIMDRVEEPKFFIFGATDMSFTEQFQKNLGLNESNSVNLSEKTITQDNQHEDMFLMRYCKHAILANSSYSFWSAYLNNDANNIVIAPTPWLLDNDNIVCDDWIKISSK